MQYLRIKTIILIAPSKKTASQMITDVDKLPKDLPDVLPAYMSCC
jgi:hypothetical protein